MTYESNLYGGWWVLAGAVGLGLVLLAASFGGALIWLSLVVLITLSGAALYAWRVGYGPRRTLSAVLSNEGVTLLGHPDPPAGWEADLFLAWEQIEGVSVVPRPGYWQTWLKTTLDPESWLLAGTGLELAEALAQFAGLTLDESAARTVNMGTEHYWAKTGSPQVRKT